MSRFALVIVPLALAMAVALAACGERDASHETKTGGSAADKPATPAAAAHTGAVVVLGDAAIGGFQAHVTRDEGAITPGKDAPIDVTVKPTAGSAAKVAAVRFWIGLEDGKVSVKAKADVENPSEPDRWHTHAGNSRSAARGQPNLGQSPNGLPAKRRSAPFRLKTDRNAFVHPKIHWASGPWVLGPPNCGGAKRPPKLG